MLRLSDVLRHPLGGYALAVGATLVTTAVTLVLRPFVHPFVSPPFLFLVLIVGRKLGAGPAVAAAALSVAAFALLFITPNDPVITEETDLAATVVFLGALALAWLATTMRGRATRIALVTREAATADVQDETHSKDGHVAERAQDVRERLDAIRAALDAIDATSHDHESVARSRAAILHEIDQLGRVVDDLLAVVARRA